MLFEPGKIRLLGEIKENIWRIYLVVDFVDQHQKKQTRKTEMHKGKSGTVISHGEPKFLFHEVFSIVSLENSQLNENKIKYD